jgi:branched-chain amino acid transport system permease protein
MDILPQLIVNSIIAGAIYSMVALGFNLIYGTVKFFDLGYGALTAVGVRHHYAVVSRSLF